MLTVILRFIYLLSIALWIGGMAFFSFMAAPSIFKVLAREEAGKVVADIFPKYYWQGIICGAIALLTSVVLGLRDAWNMLLIVPPFIIGGMVIGGSYSV